MSTKRTLGGARAGPGNVIGGGVLRNSRIGARPAAANDRSPGTQGKGAGSRAKADRLDFRPRRQRSACYSGTAADRQTIDDASAQSLLGAASRNGKYGTLRRSRRTAHGNRTTIFTVWPVDLWPVRKARGIPRANLADKL